MESMSARGFQLKCMWNRRFNPKVFPFRQLSTVNQPATKLKKGLFLQSNVSSRWVPTQMYTETCFHTSSPSFSTPSDANQTSEEFLNNVKTAMFKPKVSEELARDLASRIYGLEVTEIKSMNSLQDQNYHIKVSKTHQNPNIEEVSADGYTLKIMNTVKNDFHGQFEAMHTAMMHLQKKGLRVPQPIRTRDGKRGHFEAVPLQENGGGISDKNLKCGIHLLTYMPGAPLSSIACTPDHFFQWGSLLATFHKSLEDLDCPALKSQHSLLDLKYFPFLREATEDAMKRSVYDDETKLIIKKIFAKFPSEIEKHRHNLPQGFLHGDFNDHNLLVQCKDSGNAVYTIDGVLDFKEMHFGPYVWDLGMTLGYVLLASMTVDPLKALRQAIAGYRSCRPLHDLELSLLKPCIGARLVMMTLIPPVKDPNDTYSAKLAQLKPKIDMLKLLDTYFYR